MSRRRTRPVKAPSVPAGSRYAARSAAGFWLAAGTYLVLLAGTNIATPLYGHYESAFGFGPATVTAVFAVYVGALIPSLLFVGPLSDAIGRTRVLLPAIGLAIAGAALFAAASSTDWLYAARVVQGLALGAASGPVTALIVEREPNAERGHAAMVAAVAAVGGVGLGPLLGGVLAQYLPAPALLAYLVEIVLLAAAAIATALLPDSSARTRYRPRRPGIPEGIGGAFATSGATSFVTWAVTAIFLTLVPSYTATLTHSANLGLQGGVVAVLFATSALTQRLILMVAKDPLTLQRRGLAALVAALGLLCGAGVEGSLWLLVAASLVAGAGQGLAFLGAMREINAVAPPGRHAEVLSGFYVVTYLGTGLPVLGVGFLATSIGLLPAVEWFSAAAAAIALLLLAVLWRQAGRTHPDDGGSPTLPGDQMAGGGAHAGISARTEPR
ncbi:MAG: MFS transporter [Actinomycetota bacterium]|nr:MFS transporter [Actinomycetota bacterium]